jgi:hypothetical protein
MENRNGEEDCETPSVDKGRYPHAENARARESENECDRAQTKADSRSDVSESNAPRCDARDTTKEEKDLRAPRT